MNKYKPYIDFLIVFLLSVLAGFNIFLSFILAPALFSNFDHRLAGEVMNVIFPLYFSSGWIIGLAVYTLIAILSIKDKQIINQLKLFIVLLSILILSYMALHKAILPIGQASLGNYYALVDEGKKEQALVYKERFETVHKISSTLNGLNLILAVGLAFLYYRKSCKKD